MAAGRGVMFTDVTSFVELSGKTKVMSRRGTLQYGKSGFAASDISVIVADQDKVIHRLRRRARHHRRKGVLQEGQPPRPQAAQGQELDQEIPAGVSGAFSPPVNAAEPETLKALTSMGRQTGLTYTGNITFQQLSKMVATARDQARVQTWERVAHLVDAASQREELDALLVVDPRWDVRRCRGWRRLRRRRPRLRSRRSWRS